MKEVKCYECSCGKLAKTKATVKCEEKQFVDIYLEICW